MDHQLRGLESRRAPRRCRHGPASAAARSARAACAVDHHHLGGARVRECGDRGARRAPCPDHGTATSSGVESGTAAKGLDEPCAVGRVADQPAARLMTQLTAPRRSARGVSSSTSKAGVGLVGHRHRQTGDPAAPSSRQALRPTSPGATRNATDTQSRPSASNAAWCNRGDIEWATGSPIVPTTLDRALGHPGEQRDGDSWLPPCR